MSHLKKLQNLRLYHNKFVACFKEYQIFVIQKLKSLQKLDDYPVTMSMRERIRESGVLALEMYDQPFKKRQDELARRLDTREQDRAGAPKLAKFHVIIECLEEVMEDPSDLAAHVACIRETAKTRATASGMGDVFREAFWEAIAPDGTNADKETVVTYGLELITAVMERHDTSRGALLDTIGYLACVDRYRMGYKCMEQLRRMMCSSDTCREEATRALEFIVVPSMVQNGKANIYSKNTKNMLLGLVDMAMIQEITDEVCNLMEQSIPMMRDWFMTEEVLSEQTAHLVKLFSFVTRPEAHARSIGSAELAQRLIQHLENKTLFDNSTSRGLWLDLLVTARNLVTHCSEEIVDIFYGASMHAKAVARSRSIIKLSRGRHNESPLDSRTLSELCKFNSAMMSRSQQVVRECVDPICLHEVLCTLLRPHVVNPLILDGCCTCLSQMLNDPIVYAKQSVKIAEELRKLVPLLQFLTDKKYPDLYRLAMLNQGKSGKDLKVPTFAEMTDNSVADAMKGIVSLVAFFAAEDESTTKDDAREMVNEAMNAQDRESVLLRLLAAPHDDLKLMIMRCLSKVPLSQIENDEMGAILKCLGDVDNISEGRTEEMLALVVKQLNRLVLAPGETGVSFRTLFAERAMAESSEILLENACRSTQRESDEVEKLALSKSIVAFFYCCSQIPALRSCLRSQTINEMFPIILKSEEELHSPKAEDYCLEQTWTGKSLENLLICLQGERQLLPNKKVAMRVLASMANLIEGRHDYRWVHGKRKRRMRSLQDMAIEEAKMWDVEAVERGHRLLDNQEWQNRISQAQGFLGAHGPLRILEFLLDTNAKEREEYYMDQFKKASEKPEQLLNEAENMIVEGASKEQQPDEAEMVDIEADEGHIYAVTAGRDALMMSLQRSEEDLDDDHSALFALRPDSLTWDEDIFVDVKKGEVNPVYPVAAFLRVCNALLTCPPRGGARRSAIRRTMQSTLRHPASIAKMLALVNGLPSLACNIAAKFLRLMTLTLTISAEDEEIGFPKLEHYSVVMLYVQRLAESVLYLLKLTKDQRLALKEEVLSVEIARFMSALVNAVPWLASWTDQVATQRFCVEQCLDWLIPPVTIRVLVAMVLYDLQVDGGGGGGRNIHGEFVKEAYNRTGMKEVALTTLSKILVRCTKYRYDVLEVFSVGEVFLAQNVRPSFLGELLGNINVGVFMMHVETFISGLKKEDVRVIQMEAVEMEMFPGNGYETYLLTATNKSVFLLKPNTDPPPYAKEVDKGNKWNSSWETLFPRDPTVVWERQYANLERMWSCYGSQIFAIEWTGMGTRGMTETDEGSDPDPYGIYSEVYLCQGMGRDMMTERLNAYSRARSDSVEGCPVMVDPVFRNAVLAHVESKESVLAATVATLGPTPAKGLFASGAMVADQTPHFFVLTTKKVLEFAINAGDWQPGEMDHSLLPEDFHPEDLQETEEVVEEANEDEDEEQTQLNTDTLDDEELTRRHIQRLLAAVGKTAAPQKKNDEKKGDHMPVLTLTNTYTLPPSEIHFETRNEADLTLIFGGPARCIRFYTDTFRENWRRALAYILTKLDSAWERKY
eukprot:TRINITY_DN47486_c0_g1_i1.p1 TRINITY_DN47486_c0_g1~~TRINITY_DN47486_c0_g1_i1.p1  ORF type:complete len:1808 (+),score=359.26 TRINITY_DN47486_c0_g1_i1:717-5426(+)